MQKRQLWERDDADLADLRGFAFAFGKGFFSHKFSQIFTN